MHGRLLSPFTTRLPINPNAPERSQAIGETQRLFASGERERYAAGRSVRAVAEDHLSGIKVKAA
ncbi:MAG: hypothetical protein F6K28_48070 [Microcoleus sp. SIO2G3]|nr:hypothetical protein [Microcoleus sp. SIO2G3]